MSKITTGDDVDFLVNCENSDGTAADFSTASEVKAVLVSPDRTQALTQIYGCLGNASGANWAAGAVIIPVIGTDTVGLENRKGVWEVQVIVGGRKKTYHDLESVSLIKGWIP